MALKTTSPATNGAGRRKCQSWIDSFVEEHERLESPKIFRKWTAIAIVAAVLEQKVWMRTAKGILYPNLYTVLVGHPGVHKTVTINEAVAYYRELPEPHLAPVSMTASSLIDALVKSKRIIPQLPNPALEYNSMLIAADELGAFVHKYDDEMIAVLSAFYSPIPYGHTRRGHDIDIKIPSPQLNVLCGSTPSNLLKFIPEGAWDQGFTSRLILIFSDERIVGDDFAQVSHSLSANLLHDLKVINAQVGEYGVSEDYRKLVNDWRETGENPQPNHPKLLHYATRRRAHLYKLSVIAAMDRSSALLLTADDFHRAKGWLEEAEAFMPDIFKAGGTSSDSKSMDEIYHFVLMYGKVVPETRLMNFIRERVPVQSISRIVEIMMKSDMIEPVSIDKKTGLRQWRAVVKAEP